MTTVLTVTTGLPRDPEGDVALSRTEAPLQLGLLGLALVAGLLPRRFESVAAVLLPLTGGQAQ